MSLLDQTEKAIHTFYNSENSPERQSAHEWLLSLQKSHEAWEISWMLLNAQKPVEAQYYGVIILHYKIGHCIQDIERSQLSELSAKFPQLLMDFSGGPKLVISKLCYAYAALLIQVAKEDFNLLKCLEDLENNFKTFGCEAKSVVVELMTAFVIEFKTLNLSSNKKVDFRTALTTFIPALLSMCKCVLQAVNSSDTEVTYQLDILTCLLRWVEFGVSIADCSEIFPILLMKLPCEDLSDKVCEVIVELITAPTSYSYHETIFSMLEQIMRLRPLIEKAIADENLSLLNNICMIYTNMGETHCQLFIKVTEREKQIAVVYFVQQILAFTATKGQYPVEETCSELTLNFWYTLQDDLYSVDISEITEYQKQFVTAYLVLINVFYEKCQYPVDEVYLKFNDDEREMFRCYRIDVQDTMLYVYTLLQEECLKFFLYKLKSLLADDASKWYQFESVLHLLRGASESFDIEDSTYIPEVLSTLSKLPNHPKLMDSVVFFLGSLSEWLNCHPEQIETVLPFLIRGVMNPDTAAACTISLKDICHECARLMSESLVMETLQTCYKALELGRTPSKIAVRYFEIAGYLISTLPHDHINCQLEILVAFIFHRFKDILTEGNGKVCSKKKLVHYMNCFLGLFRTLDPFEELAVHPVSTVFGQLIPLFNFLKPWCGYEEIVVAATQCINKAIEISREKLSCYIDATGQCLANFFSAKPYGCILDASSTLIGMFGLEAECTECVKTLYDFLTHTCICLIEGGEARNYPDCAQSFMDLLTRVIKTVPEFLISNKQQQASVIKCALILLNHQEAPTIKATTNFLITYINFSSCFSVAKEMIEFVGRDIIIQSLLCIGGVAPRHTTDHFADVILALNKSFVSPLAGWLNDVFTRDDFPTANATSMQKDHFRKAVLREKSSKRRMKEIVNDFSLACRGLKGMAYVH